MQKPLRLRGIVARGALRESQAKMICFTVAFKAKTSKPKQMQILGVLPCNILINVKRAKIFYREALNLGVMNFNPHN